MINIAIDGPAGAGKSTVAKQISKKLGIIYLDTGAMYRAVALKALNNKIDPNNEKYVIPMLESTVIAIEYRDGNQHIFLDGTDVSTDIRRHEISKAASDISKIHAVRLRLVEMQREIAAKNDLVMDGRDTTSFVLPESKHKFYLTASAEERAKRRWLELKEKGFEEDFDKILNDIRDRDFNDMNRDFAPLIQTDDAVFIDSTDMQADEVADLILGYIK